MVSRLRYAFRMLLKQPAFTAIAVFTLALGIGANTAIFSVVNAVLLRPLPFEQPEQLVRLGSCDTRLGNTKDIDSLSYPNFEDWRAQNKVFSHIAVYAANSLTLTTGREALHVQAVAASADLFALLGVQPRLGRTFLAREDEAGTRVAILSHDFWQRRFGGDPSVLDRPIILDGASYQVVGVMPPGFQYPIQETPTELWTSIAPFRQQQEGEKAMTEQRGNEFLNGIARLKPGVTLAQAQSAVDTIAAGLAREYPDSDAHSGGVVISLLSAVVGPVRPALLMLLATAGCVLLVACVNVANLLVARSIVRQKEISIRAALGAGRRDIILQLLTESALLGIFGGLVGLLIAVWGIDSLAFLLPSNLPRASQISPDARVLAFTICISLGVGCLAGLMPAWRASHPNLVSALNESGRGSSESGHGLRVRGVLVVIEIMLALVLLCGAGLLGQSFLRLREVNPGFDPHGVMSVRIALPDAGYAKPAQAADFYKRLIERVSALPGVTSASSSWWLPLSGSEIAFDVQDEEHPLPESQRPSSQANVVTPEYFKTLHIPLLRGRSFTERDTAAAPLVVVVTESFARKFFPGQDPIGKRITPGGTVGPGKPPVREVVGVVGDAKFITLKADPKPLVYMPLQQFGVQGMSLLVRTSNDPAAILPALRASISELDPNVPLYRPRSLDDYLQLSVAQPRFNALLVGLFSTVALLLAAAGIFGVMSYSVTQRTQEIGIRLALGAQRFDVLRLIVGQGMRLVAIGLASGLLATFALTRLLGGLIYGIGATDLATLVGVSIILGLVAFLACWLPARRASGIDPMVALREG
jgi:putative ABC transport system permease protein